MRGPDSRDVLMGYVRSEDTKQFRSTSPRRDGVGFVNFVEKEHSLETLKDIQMEVVL
jgi:hypothetical protein